VIDESEIGKRIKEFRKQNHLTLQDLADRTGYSKGYLSKVEKAQKAPPVSTLGVIAGELGVTVAGIIGEESIPDSISVVRKSERKLMAGSGKEFGYSYEALANPYPNKLMEPFILYPSENITQNTFKHDGEEVLFILQGKLNFKYGDREILLEEGDAIYFDSGVPHTGEAVGDEMVKCFVVICNLSSRGQVSYEHLRQRVMKTDD